MEFVFLGIFTVELALRLIVSGPKKFFSYNNDDFSWTGGHVDLVDSMGQIEVAIVVDDGAEEK